MKRSRSAPCLKEESKKLKVLKDPNGKEYLQSALARILELERAMKDDSYTASDVIEADSDENIMKEVLIKVFKDLPGSSKDTPNVINSLVNNLIIKKSSEMKKIHAKSVQLSGYDTCRQVAINFMKNTVKNSPKYHFDDPSNRRLSISNDFQIKSTMLNNLDTHLAVKQRDYTFKLMNL